MKKPALLLFVLFACNFISGQAKKPFVLGEILEIQSVQLSEKRILNIYLPQGYKQDDTIRYPVIYLLDGSADEDFVHIAGLVQYCNFPWVNILPKSILVGIANVDRKRDFTFPTTVAKDKQDYPTTGRSLMFIDFIEKELQPFIDRKYKTNQSRTIIGQSLGGLLASEILFKRPSLFSKYIIISPSLWWDNESLLGIDTSFPKKGIKDKIPVYIAVGNEGDVMTGDAKRLNGILQQHEMTDARFKFFEKEDHATIFHQAVYDAFESLNKK